MSLASGLSITGDRESGIDVRQGNVTAVMSVANILRTSLGPQGLDKMVVDEGGEVTVTNDGATILQKLEVQHPAATLLTGLAQVQDNEIGDGTTSVVLTSAELLKRGHELVKQGIHPTNVISGYMTSMKEAVKYIKENLSCAVSSLGEDTLEQIARTSLSSKFIGADAEKYAKLAVDAVKSVKVVNPNGKAKYPVNQINVVKSHGKSSTESILIPNGYAMQLMRVAQGCPTRVENAKIALLDFDLKKFQLRSAEILVEDPNELEKIRQKEMDITRDRIMKIIEAGANVIMTSKGMDDMSIKYLVQAGCLGVRRVDKADMKRLAKCTGARVQLTLATIEGDEAFDADCLGYADVVEEERVGDNDFIFVKGCKSSKASTMLLRGANEFLLEETERSMHDAMMAVSKTCESNYVVPGGGSVETALNIHLTEYAAGLEDGRLQLPIMEFAEALLMIPTTLCVNAAVDPIQLISELRVAHQAARNSPGKADQRFTGLDLVAGKTRNSVEAGVLEPMMSKLKSLKFATEAAVSILRIDDLVKLDPEDKGQGGGMPGM